MLDVYQPVDPAVYSDVSPTAPDPGVQEVADLMTEWYQLFIDMRYVDASRIAFPPHKHQKIDTAGAAALGLTKDVVDLFQLLPYNIGRGTNWNFGSDAGEFLLWGEFLRDHRGPDVDWWQMQVDPFYAMNDLAPEFRGRVQRRVRQDTNEKRDWNHEEGPYIRPWFATLTDCGNHGSIMVLNTENYRMWLIDQLGGTSDPELRGKPFKIPELANKRDLDRFPSRPAAEFLRDMISRFRKLEWIPGGLYDSKFEYYEDYKELYQKCGWPGKFNPILFDKLRFEGGEKFGYQASSPKPTKIEKSYAGLSRLYGHCMAGAREIVQQQIHLVDATYKLEKGLYEDDWERRRLEGQILNTERTLQPMKNWENDQAKLRTELDFQVKDLEALRTRSGRFAGPGWAGVSINELHDVYQEEKPEREARITTIQTLLADQDANARAEREFREAKQAAKDTPQDAWEALAESHREWENDDWKDRWSILGSGTIMIDIKTVVEEDLSWEELQRRIVYELEKNEDRSWRGQRLWRNDEGKVAMVLSKD